LFDPIDIDEFGVLRAVVATHGIKRRTQPSDRLAAEPLIRR
jgi:hypothetical protein